MFTAKFPGVCCECDEDIAPGDLIRYTGEGSRSLAHERCGTVVRYDTSSEPRYKFQGTTLEDMGF